MKQHLFSACMLSALLSMGQAPAIQWQKSLGGTSIDKGNAIQQTADGGYIVTGETSSSDGDVTMNNGTTDYWVAKLDASGVLTWQKSLGGAGDDRANAVIQTSDGGYAVAGTSNSTGGNITAPKGQYDFWIVKLDATGTVTWQKSLGGTAIDEAHAIQQTTDGGFVIVGDTRSNNLDITLNNGNTDIWVVKTDASGVIQWQKTLGGSGTENGYSVQQTSDGGFIVCGQTDSNNADVSGNNGGVDFWVIKLSSTGTITWQKCLGGTGSEEAYSVKQTSDGGYIVAGKTDSNNGNVSGNNGAENAWVVKLSSTGSMTWQKCYGGSAFDGANSIQQTADGGYIFGGVASSNNANVSGNHGSNDYWVVKLTASGAIDWQKCLGGTSSDVANSIQQTNDYGYVVAGRSASSNNDVTNAKGLDDFWVVRFAGSPVGLHAVSLDAQVSVYPNPAHSAVTVSGDALAGSTVQIMNAAGQLVYKKAVNATSCQVDLSGFSAGVYLLQITDAGGAISGIKKLVVE